jgi:hypothetical protein
MKYFKALFIVFVIAACISCKKSKSIDYPATGFFGKNILTFTDGSMLEVDKDYSMTAVLGKKATLQLQFTNYSVFDSAAGNPPLWGFGQETGWFSTNYDDLTGTQKFEASQTGKVDLDMMFMRWGGSHPGHCRVEFFENSATVTKTIYLNW